jgi:hypothetical protein
MTLLQVVVQKRRRRAHKNITFPLSVIFQEWFIKMN